MIHIRKIYDSRVRHLNFRAQLATLITHKKYSLCRGLDLYTARKYPLNHPRKLFTTTGNLLQGRTNGPEAVLKSILNPKFIEHLRVDLTGEKIAWIISGGYPKGIQRRYSAFLIGPNINFLPEEEGVLDTIKPCQYLVPSDWVLNLFNESIPALSGKLSVWPAGIEVPDVSPILRTKVILYFKRKEWVGHARVEIDEIKSVIAKLGFDPIEIFYGEYRESSFNEILQKTKFAIWFGETESQGMALLRCWANNVPTLIKTAERFAHESNSYPASAAPYLSPDTGVFFNGMIPTALEVMQILNIAKNGTSRNWVLENLSLQKSAKILSGILQHEVISK